jgi:hypothetical protein
VLVAIGLALSQYSSMAGDPSLMSANKDEKQDIHEQTQRLIQSAWGFEGL